MEAIHKFSIQTAAVLGLVLVPQFAFALSCMVVGEKTARVQTSEGQMSPVFMSRSCETLKLISGKAMVSWISRDGKPNFSPIGPEGVSKLPAPGSDERSANVVWTEISSNREAKRPAFMRALDQERPARLYIPIEGLVFPAAAESVVTVKLVGEKSETLIVEKKQSEAEPLRLSRETLTAGSTFAIEITGGSKKERWLVKQVDANEAARIDQQISELSSAGIDSSQQQVLQAMLYEQLKLPVNMSLALQVTP